MQATILEISKTGTRDEFLKIFGLFIDISPPKLPKNRPIVRMCEWWSDEIATLPGTNEIVDVAGTRAVSLGIVTRPTS